MLLSSGKDPYWEGWVSSDPENVCRLCSMMSTVLIFMDGLLPQVEKFKHLSVLEVGGCVIFPPTPAARRCW